VMCGIELCWVRDQMLYLVSGNGLDRDQEVESDHQGGVGQDCCHLVFLVGDCVMGMYVHGI
jgi:hypothetical protein